MLYPMLDRCGIISLPLDNDLPWTDEMFLQFIPSVSYFAHVPYRLWPDLY